MYVWCTASQPRQLGPTHFLGTPLGFRWSFSDLHFYVSLWLPTSCSFARARLLWFVVVISRYWSWAFYISHTCCAGNFQLQRHNIYLSRAWFLFNVDWPLSRRRRLRWRRGGLIGDLLSSLVRGRPRASELVLYATSADYIIYEAAF